LVYIFIKEKGGGGARRGKKKRGKKVESTMHPNPFLSFILFIYFEKKRPSRIIG
jgi:hypothetical protein